MEKTLKNGNINDINQSILVIGGGKMAQALLTGFYDKNLINNANISIIEPHFETRQFLLQNKLVLANNIFSSFAELSKACFFNFVFLAIKPQMFSEITHELKNIQMDYVVSIMAGVTILKIADAFDIHKNKVIRTMPNTPAMVCNGFTGIYWSAMNTNAEVKSIINALFKAVGTTLWLDKEEQLNDITALSGSGPAYVFHLLEIWQQAAQNYGFDVKTAQDIAWNTLHGSILLAKNQDFTALKNNVTSQKGTTAAALDYLYEHHWGTIFAQAIECAKKRSEELSN